MRQTVRGTAANLKCIFGQLHNPCFLPPVNVFLIDWIIKGYSLINHLLLTSLLCLTSLPKSPQQFSTFSLAFLARIAGWIWKTYTSYLKTLCFVLPHDCTLFYWNGSNHLTCVVRSLIPSIYASFRQVRKNPPSVCVGFGSYVHYDCITSCLISFTAACFLLSEAVQPKIELDTEVIWI